MSPSAIDVTTQSLSLPEELVLMLLNEENGYFHQVPGWNLQCAIVGAALAELSLSFRIDTDLGSLFVVDRTETGDPALDPILEEIASDRVLRNTQYWIERLAPRAEPIIDLTLDRLVASRILEHHEGGFWTLAPTAQRAARLGGASGDNAAQFAKERIRDFIFESVIPDPRDIIIISLVNTCDVLRFMFPLDDVAEARIRFICNMDLIGRSIAAAVSQSMAAPRLRRSALAREIPTVSLRRLLLNPHVRDGNIPALFADLVHEYGPVFQLRPPFTKPLIFLGGPETNRWVHRNGRMYLTAKDYLTDFERVYGASGILPGTDGADHFRLRKAMQPAMSRARFEEQLDDVYRHARAYMSNWSVGDVLQASTMGRKMMNAQLSPLTMSIDSQDLIDDLIDYKARSLSTHVSKVLPKFMLNTPGMKRRAKSIDEIVDRIQIVHTPAQRAGRTRDLGDDLLSLHTSDPQFLPESNLRFALSAALIVSLYIGDMLSFAVYAMASQPALYDQIRSEADALFDKGDPGREDLAPSEIDITRRFLMECMRMYPSIPMGIRDVMNSCVVEDYELPVGTRVHIAQTAAHYMEEVFPDPFTFDIDRYLPPRNEHLSPGYAPFGLGTHTCLGSRWVEMQLAVNVLMIAHHFTIKLAPEDYKLRFSPFPSMSLGKKLKFVISERRRELAS